MPTSEKWPGRLVGRAIRLRNEAFEKFLLRKNRTRDCGNYFLVARFEQKSKRFVCFNAAGYLLAAPRDILPV